MCSRPGIHVGSSGSLPRKIPFRRMTTNETQGHNRTENCPFMKTCDYCGCENVEEAPRCSRCGMEVFVSGSKSTEPFSEKANEAEPELPEVESDVPADGESELCTA